MKLKFNKTYYLIFIVIFIAEIFITTYIKTGFIRHTFGDFLVVILIYAFIKSFLSIKPTRLGICVLIFAFFIEFLQFFNILKTLNLQNHTLAKLVLGSTFQVSDLIAYTLGIIFILAIEYNLKRF
ncbi:ribosomal maturation YjgA family protein [Formosa maritima]|uniref:DUF2809 domain-containing protein n=1 Tax=Formosa maritima TaxID=2592046 RepID=A0A5D0GHB4_9FLAO|nr:DUF2809 domain-containing protein [Formosa maritima]TYA58273.1 DUF2809 domain-containing protein [Formosa maritima]